MRLTTILAAALLLTAIAAWLVFDDREQVRDYQQTRERIDNAPDLPDSADGIERVLRDLARPARPH